MKRLVFIALVCVLSTGCASSSSTIPSLSGATRCKITFVNQLTGRGDEPLKELTSPSEVANLVAFADKQILSASDWCHLTKVQDRSAVLNVSFYDGSEYKGTLGIGPYAKDKFFLKYHNIGTTKVICISNKEKNEFVRLIGASQEEYGQIFDSKNFFP